MSPTEYALAHGINVAAIIAAANMVARVGGTESRLLLRAGILAAFVFLDATLMLWLDFSIGTVLVLLVALAVSSMTLPPRQTILLSQSLGRARFPLYLSSVCAVSLLVHVHLPIITFLTSPGEIGIHITFLLTQGVTDAMIVVYCAALLYAILLPPRMKSLLTWLAFSSFIVALVYAFALPFGYPMMTGLQFEQIPITGAQLALRAAIDTFTVALCALTSLMVLIKVDKRHVLGAVVLVNGSLVVASAVAVARDDDVREARSGLEQEEQQPIRYSADAPNVLVLFLDRFMGGFVEQILRDETQLAGALDGFTWYPRTVASGENSIAGLHPLLGGYDYIPSEINQRGQPLRDTTVESYAILPYNFTRHGYLANLVNPAGLGFTVDGDCSFLSIDGLRCSHIPASVAKNMAVEHGMPMEALSESLYGDLLSLLGLMRVSPYAVRAAVHEKGPWKPFLDHSAGTTFKEWAELSSLPALSAVQNGPGNLNIVFNILPHEPYFLNEECLPVRARFDLPRDEVIRKGHGSLFSLQHYIGARCTLRIVGEYLAWMRNRGVYDNTMVVIVSDHGIVGPVMDLSSRAMIGRTTDNMYVRSRSVLLVKKRNSRGALRVSEDFVPNAEVPYIVCKEIGGCVNPYLGNRTIEAHGRRLPYYVDFVPWQFNLQSPTRFRINRRLALVSGDPYDATAWRDLGSPDR